MNRQSLEKKPPGWNHERKPVDLRPQAARARARLRAAALGALALVLSMSGPGLRAPTAAGAAQEKAQDSRPDILLILMDDVGIDQMTAFGFGGIDPAIDAQYRPDRRLGREVLQRVGHA